MRWLYADENNALENAQRKEIAANIAAWWSEFRNKIDDLRSLFAGSADWNLVGWMAAHLQAIHPQLMWEFGPSVHGDGHRLVITPECEHHLRPLTAAILERAPQLPGWEFYSYRLPEDMASAQLTVQGRTGCNPLDAKVRVARGDHHRIDLRYLFPNAVEDAQSRSAAFIATEAILGEECLNRWIGTIDIVSSPSRGGLRSLLGLGAKEEAGLLPLERLKETVDALIGSIREQLPQRPHYAWAGNVGWTLWKLTPGEASDYPEQSDLFVSKSANPAMWTAAHSGALFSSERFSSCGETFCYVKLDGSEGLDEEIFSDKSAIEDALDVVLKPEELGCGGTGLRYSYIDLALCDPKRGVEAVKDRLQAGNVPRRSWIQFYDTDLAAEWVGIYDDTPPPPMPHGD